MTKDEAKIPIVVASIIGIKIAEVSILVNFEELIYFLGLPSLIKRNERFF